MPECYVTKKGYQVECNKPLHRGWGSQNGSFFRFILLTEPKEYGKNLFVKAFLLGYIKCWKSTI